MTQEEVENNYTYKIVRKVLMSEYPWIKDVQLDVPRLENFKYVIFLDIYIDPYESTILSLFFVGTSPDMSELKLDVNITIEDVQKSPAIPPEMRMPDGRFMVGSFFTAKNITIPEPEPDDYPF